jgi:hypothetical protein
MISEPNSWLKKALNEKAGIQKIEEVSKTELLEVSMTNVPGDRDAIGIATLSSENGGDLTRLSSLKFNIKNTNNNTEMDLTKIAKQLGLSETATEVEILKALEGLQLANKVAVEEKVNTLMTLGLAKGVVNEANKEAYKKLAMTDYDSTASLIQNAEIKVATKQLSISDILKSGSAKTTTSDKLDFEKLSKENPKELKRIMDEEPEIYKAMALSYASGK